jgi:lipopolysaccharide transport system permease protein
MQKFCWFRVAILLEPFIKIINNILRPWEIRIILRYCITMNQESEKITIIKPNSNRWPLTPGDFWRWKEAIYRLLIKDFLVRFKGTYLGFFWILIQPLCFLVVLSIFIKNEEFESINISTSNYVLSGLIFWFFITNSFNQTAMSLLDNRSLISQTNLKRAILPICAIFSKLIDLVIGIGFLLCWIMFDSIHLIKITSPLILLDILGILLTLVGLGWIFSVMCIRFKDVRHTIPFVSQLMFFATPIFYITPSINLKWVVMMNPFSYFILAVRDHLFGIDLISTQSYLVGWVLCLSLFLVGGLLFGKYEKNLADMI